MIPGTLYYNCSFLKLPNLCFFEPTVGDFHSQPTETIDTLHAIN